MQIRNYERNQQSFRLCAEKLGEKLPNDFRTEKEFGSVLFPLVNVSSILRNADKDETSCITDLHLRWKIEFTYSIVTRQSVRTMISGIPIDTAGILPSEMAMATQLAA